jgi:hypothetical protein
LAKKYGVTKTTIKSIRNGRTWGYLTGKKHRSLLAA